ncbi:MAG: nucleoside 2-deoxyribosyltransferase [Clostridiales bacterium]|nr:nucleoside 2-deoxyribosyltransferase [Clostridiales bacterium]
MYLYISGPFFNDEEIANVEYVESVLDEKGYTYFSPMRHSVGGEVGSQEWAEKIFEMDRDEIMKADAMVTLYYGNYSDTGTAWECGYATAMGIPVILVHVDEANDANLMLHCGSTTNIYLKDLADYDFETLPEYPYEGDML